MTTRNSEDIEKMLAWNIISQIHNCSCPPGDWIQIGPFPHEMRKELKFLVVDAYQHINGVNIIGNLDDLKVRFLKPDMEELEIAMKISKEELISIMIVAIKHRIPIKDFSPGLEIDWNVDNPMIKFI